MQKIYSARFLFLVLAITAVTPLFAQAPPAGKPPLYLYTAEWAVPRAQWSDINKVSDADKPLLDKLVADGTLTGYGSWDNLLHQEGQPTHGTWFAASSEGKLLKALEAIYAQPSLVGSPVQAASKHWDGLLVETVYGGKSGSSGGYLTWSTWQFKPGEMKNYMEQVKKLFVPVLDKLVADGTITSYGELTEDYHTSGKLGMLYEYFTVPDAASLDKANDALEAVFNANPTFAESMRNMTTPDGHSDHLTHLRYMSNK